MYPVYIHDKNIKKFTAERYFYQNKQI